MRKNNSISAKTSTTEKNVASSFRERWEDREKEELYLVCVRKD